MKFINIKNKKKKNLIDELKQKGWDRVADAYAHDRRTGSIHHRFIGDPALFKLVGKIFGKKILDAGCGEGFVSRELARRGAKVVGVDLSKKLLKLAQSEEIKTPLGVNYHNASLENLSCFPSGEFDMVVSNLVLHDLEKLTEALSELNRVLKKKGEFVISLLHPNSGKEKYFQRGWYESKWGGKYKTLASYHRTMSDYVTALAKEGFLIEKIIEPRPITGGLKYKELQEWDKKPLFVLIKAIKVREEKSK